MIFEGTKKSIFFGLGLTRAGKGYPDISLLEPLAKEFHVSITELLSGNAVSNANVSANMLRSLFYVCPVCGNVIHCMGEAVSSDCMQIVRRYPEGNAEARFRMDGVRSIYFYCNRDGLFFADPVKGIGCQEKHPFSSSANSSI